MKQPINATDELQARASRAFEDDATIKVLPSSTRNSGTQSFVIHGNAESYCVTVRTGQFEPELQTYKQDAIETVLTDHKGWLAIQRLNSNDSNDDWRAKTSKLIRELLDDNCLAVSFEFENRVVLNSPAFHKLLMSEDFVTGIKEVGTGIWLIQKTDDDPQLERELRECRRGLRGFSSAFATRKPEQKFLIKVEQLIGHTTESYWLEVDRIERGRYTNTFVGTLTNDSLLIPGRTKGEPLSVVGYHITDWQYDDGQTVHRGRPKRQ